MPGKPLRSYVDPFTMQLIAQWALGLVSVAEVTECLNWQLELMQSKNKYFFFKFTNTFQQAFMFLMLFCPNSAHFSEILLVCGRRTDTLSNRDAQHFQQHISHDTVISFQIVDFISNLEIKLHQSPCC